MIRQSALLALVLTAVACGPVVTTSSTVEPTTTTRATTTTVPPPTTSPTTSTTSTTPTSTTTTIPIVLQIDDAWEGELVEYGPQPGSQLAVVGVRYNDVLNVREGPGADFPVVSVLLPLDQGVDALGLTWLNPGSIWFGIESDGIQGWANASFLLLPGQRADITNLIVDRLSGVPESGSLIELANDVAEAMASDEPRSVIEQPAPVVVGDVGEMILDVIGLGDDSVGGFRLRIVANNVDGTWVLDRVEGIPLCSRGVQQGSCV